MEAVSSSQSASPRRVSPRDLIAASLALLAGACLRVWMLRFFEVSVDAEIYGGIAKNLLRHGVYAIGSNSLHLTLIRLPGYPLFLATCFRLFGMENYWSAAVLQIVLELFGCVLLAAAAARIARPQHARATALCTLWLAALCPFTAIFAVTPLTESLTLFSIACALWALARFIDRPGCGTAILFTLAMTCGALLRPDGLLVGVALALPMVLGLVRPSSTSSFRARMRIGLVCLLIAVTPFAAWTWRNWRAHHVIQPLAPRYATDPGENTWPGFQMWVKTWCLDFVSTYQIYWNVPDDAVDVQQLPARAFDSPQQYTETAKLLADYNAGGRDLLPDLDNRFRKIAEERIAANPLRYYVWLPLGRMADMWLRPRVENLPIDLDWWVYGHHRAETRFSWFYAGLNALYLLLGVVGLCLRPRLGRWMLLYFVLRSAMLCTIEAPEARYTIECFPMLFVLGGVALARIFGKQQKRAHAPPLSS